LPTRLYLPLFLLSFLGIQKAQVQNNMKHFENCPFTYKKTTLKNPDIVNYDMKGPAQSSPEA
jgi:hypothetical protein